MSDLHDYQSDPYDDVYAKAKAEALAIAQKRAVERGGLLVSEYDHYWMPRLGDICPDVRYVRGGYEADYGRFDYDIELRELSGLSGAMLFQPKAGAEIPEALAALRQPWLPAIGFVDVEARTVTVRVPEAEMEITFSKVKVGLAPYLLLKELNAGLKTARAGVWCWRLEADPGAGSTGTHARHLYPDGNVPTISNSHAVATVTGYAISTDGWARRVVYLGLAGHKSSVESIWASIVSGGRSKPTLLGHPLESYGAVKMLTSPMPEYACIHACILSTTAMPGRWAGDDTVVYALVSDGEGDLETSIRRAAYKRLQEALPYPLKEDWEKAVWELVLDQGYITRLETGGDCLAAVEINLARDWLAMLNNLLEAETVRV